MQTRRRCLFVCALGLVFATIAHAHPGHDGHELTWDLGTGFAHPFTGWDHLLAMAAIGWWAVQTGGRARWVIPLGFLSLLVVGSFLSPPALTVSRLDQLVAASVVIIGVLMATAIRLPAWAIAVVIGAFALFHGIAHGAEMPVGTGGVGYRLGFVAASAVLILGGLGLGLLARRHGRSPERIAGLLTSLAGVLLLLH